MLDPAFPHHLQGQGSSHPPFIHPFIHSARIPLTLQAGSILGVGHKGDQPKTCSRGPGHSDFEAGAEPTQASSSQREFVEGTRKILKDTKCSPTPRATRSLGSVPLSF